MRSLLQDELTFYKGLYDKASQESENPTVESIALETQVNATSEE